MPSTTSKPKVHAFEAYAWECVELAGQEACPQFRDQLLEMAREWMWLREQDELKPPPTALH
jgi:hypothetical protein